MMRQSTVTRSAVRHPRRQVTHNDLSMIRLRERQRDHSSFQADFDAVYSQLMSTQDESVLQHGASPATLIPLIMACMRLAESVSKSSGDGGSGKRELVMALMTRLIEDSGMSLEDKVAVQSVLETFGPSIIDGLIAADRGQLLGGAKSLFQRCGLCK
jgi:hypothetical protein